MREGVEWHRERTGRESVGTNADHRLSSHCHHRLQPTHLSNRHTFNQPRLDPSHLEPSHVISTHPTFLSGPVVPTISPDAISTLRYSDPSQTRYLSATLTSPLSRFIPSSTSLPSAHSTHLSPRSLRSPPLGPPLRSLAATVPQEGRRRHRQGHRRLEGSPRHRPAHHPEPSGGRLGRPLRFVLGHQGSEG
jgi:hypothetical protein